MTASFADGWCASFGPERFGFRTRRLAAVLYLRDQWSIDLRVGPLALVWRKADGPNRTARGLWWRGLPWLVLP